MATKKTTRVKKTKTPRRVYRKKMVIELVGPNKTAINNVAKAIHALNHEDRVGGADGRKVQMVCESEDTKQIYYGNV